MNIPSIAEEIDFGDTAKITDNLPANYADLTPEAGVTAVFYDEISRYAMQGSPAASEMVAPDGKTYSSAEFERLPDERKRSCRLRYFYMPNCNELYLGAGGGRTSGCIEPQLRALSSQKNKPDLFVTDTGEIFQRNARHLKKAGYRLFVLNHRNLDETDKWNPLAEVYDKKILLQHIGEGATEHFGEVPCELKPAADADEFDNFYIAYKGKAFPDDTLLDKALRKEAEIIEAETEYLIDSLADMFFTSKTQTNRSAETAAKNLLKGIIHCMAEDAADSDSGFTRDMMNIRTVQRYYEALKTPVLSDECNVFEHELTQNKSAFTLSLLNSAFCGGLCEAKECVQAFENVMEKWFKDRVFALTTGDTVKIEDGEEPFAFFVITREWEKEDNILTAPAIDWLFRNAADRAQTGKKRRALHFLLNNFENVSHIRDFECKISAARSLDIRFCLYLHSYSDLQYVYDEKAASVIKDNCNAHIFLGVQNVQTQEEFSRLCGKRKSMCSDGDFSESDAMPLCELTEHKPGKMLVKRLGLPVFTSQYIGSYVCEDCGVYESDRDGLKDFTPFSCDTFSAAKYTYKRAEDCIALYGSVYEEEADF